MTPVIQEGQSAEPARRWRVTSGEQAPQTVNRLLRSLPGWFGIETSIVDYVAKAHELPTYLAWPATRPTRPVHAQHPVGVLLAARHFPVSAEIYLMAVDPDVHRQGVGRALVATLENDLIADGVELVQVKTLGPSQPDIGYDRTRQFYARMGFRPLEEIHGLWPGNPCLIMVKNLARPADNPRIEQLRGASGGLPERFAGFDDTGVTAPSSITADCCASPEQTWRGISNEQGNRRVLDVAGRLRC